MQFESKILVEIIVFENKHALSCYNNGAPKSFSCKQHARSIRFSQWPTIIKSKRHHKTTPNLRSQLDQSKINFDKLLKWHVLSSRQLRLVRAMLLIWLKATERDYLRLAGRCIRKGRRLGQRLFWRLFWMTRTHFEWHERNRHDWRRAR